MDCKVDYNNISSHKVDGDHEGSNWGGEEMLEGESGGGSAVVLQ